MQDFSHLGSSEKSGEKRSEKPRSSSPPPSKVIKKEEKEKGFSFVPEGVPPSLQLGSEFTTTPSNSTSFLSTSASKEEESASTNIAVFGHGYYKPDTTIQAPQDIMLYGPLGSTLTRAVSKWIREKRPLKSGELRLITVSRYEELQRSYDGGGPSFDQAVWGAAKKTGEYPCRIKRGENIPSLLLDIQTEEEVPEAENVITVTKSTSLEEIGKQAKEGAVLHWAACLQKFGEKILDTDDMVLLDPKLAEEVYPQTRSEAKKEKKYQKDQEQEKKMEEAVSKSFVSRRPQVPRSIDHKNKLEGKINDVSKGNPSLLDILKNTTFSAPEEIDEGFLNKHAIEHNVGVGVLRMYISYYVIDKSPLS